MQNDKITLILPLLIIAIGVGWLLTVQGVVPDINWVWTLGLAMLGVVTYIGAGFNKFSVVVGSFFITASVLAVLRQTDRISMNVEVPVLVITLGALLLVARYPVIPIPDWYEPPAGDKSAGGRGTRQN